MGRGELRFPLKRCLRAPRGFTLLEVVLAIGLCGAVMALLTTAINLYLIRVDSNRSQVETSQLARSLLTQIGNDLRSVRFVVPNAGNSGLGGGLDGMGMPDATGSPGMGMGGGLGTDTSSLGIFGTSTELRIDRSAVRTWDVGMHESVQMLGESASQRDMPQTVIYFFNEGRSLSSEEFSAGGVVDQQSLAGYEGLARQRIPTSVWLTRNRSTAGQGPSQIQLLWNPANTELLAPEVARLEFSYFDGWEWYPSWDTSMVGDLPVAVEIRLKILNEAPDVVATLSQMERDSMRRDPNRLLEYRLLVRIPQVQPIPAQAAGPQSGGGVGMGGAGVGTDDGGEP